MNKIDFLSMSRPPVQYSTVQLEDGDVNIEVKLRALDPVASLEALELAAIKHAQYVTGLDGEMPEAFPAVGGQPVVITKHLCEVIAPVVVAQSNIDGTLPESAYDFEQLVAMFVTRPQLYKKLSKACVTISKEVTATENFTESEKKVTREEGC